MRDRLFSTGFHFVPTDEESIGFLRQKIVGLPVVSTDQFLEMDIYADPRSIFKDCDWFVREKNKTGEKSGRIYVFTRLKKVVGKGVRISRVAGGGLWKGQTGPVDIKSGDGRVIGTRKMFSFLDKKRNLEGSNNVRYIMYEYSLAGVSLTHDCGGDNHTTVLCKIKKLYKEKQPPARVDDRPLALELLSQTTNDEPPPPPPLASDCAADELLRTTNDEPPPLAELLSTTDGFLKLPVYSSVAAMPETWMPAGENNL